MTTKEKIDQEAMKYTNRVKSTMLPWHDMVAGYIAGSNSPAARDEVIDQCIDVMKQWEQNAPERFQDYQAVKDIIQSLSKLKS